MKHSSWPTWIGVAGVAAAVAVVIYAFTSFDSGAPSHSSASRGETASPRPPPAAASGAPASPGERLESPPISSYAVSTRSRGATQTAPPATPSSETPANAPAALPSARALTTPPVVPGATPALPPGPTPEGNMLTSTKPPAGAGFSPQMESVRTMLRDFRSIEGENPVGTNAEITKALMGGNKKGAQLVGEGTKLNGNGELVDQWGTPYFFHQLSKTEMEVRSAGPDGVLWTGDDQVTK